jgi:CRP/FNR family cyclic AMP-dependent transcriptional regulator
MLQSVTNKTIRRHITLPIMATLTPAQAAPLQSNLWFVALPVHVREAIIEVAELKKLADGDYSHRKDHAAEGWFGIVSGAIKISSTSPEGREAVLAFLEPGNWFGEISLFDGLPRTHDGIAHGPTELLVVSPKEFHGLLDDYPELPLHFLKLQSSRLRLLFAAMDDVNMLPFDARLAKQLINLGRSYGVAEAEGIRINLHLPQEDLAQLLGTSRQRVNVLLSDWAKKKWIAVHYGHVTLIDTAALKQLGGVAAPA